jgi:hypothetical protein
MSGKTASCRTAAQQSRTADNRRRKPQQMDLFGSGQSSVVIGAPAWPELPAETQRALIRLMTRLLLEHADKSKAAARTGGTTRSSAITPTDTDRIAWSNLVIMSPLSSAFPQREAIAGPVGVGVSSRGYCFSAI